LRHASVDVGSVGDDASMATNSPSMTVITEDVTGRGGHAERTVWVRPPVARGFDRSAGFAALHQQGSHAPGKSALHVVSSS
jgi:hypothetical protein